jgi:hypothetical protein
MARLNPAIDWVKVLTTVAILFTVILFVVADTLRRYRARVLSEIGHAASERPRTEETERCYPLENLFIDKLSH